ncbi:DUF3108 domain-containing protein, partial [Mesorhizobium sp. M2C.T.Ca.TU.009.01.2.1]
MVRSTHAFATLLALAVPATSFAAAPPQSFKGEYTVSYL